MYLCKCHFSFFQIIIVLILAIQISMLLRKYVLAQEMEQVIKPHLIKSHSLYIFPFNNGTDTCQGDSGKYKHSILLL